MRAIKTERGLDRLVNFSDATVAIAITLLVLPLVDLAGDVGDSGLAAFFSEHWNAFLGFGISFVVIGRFWVLHHRVFEWADSYSSTLINVNLVWMASIVFIPFTTNVLASVDYGRPDVNGLYVGTIVVTSAAMFAIELIMFRRPELVREDARGQIDLVRAATPTLILLVCFVLVIVLPDAGMYWLLLLLLSQPVNALLARALRRRGSQARS